MTDKKFRLGLLVMVLLFGMTVVGCGDGSTSGDGDAKTITITGITGKKGDVELELYIDDGEDLQICGGGFSKIANNSITFLLMENESTIFTGDGSYQLYLYLDEWESVFVYTNGLTLAALGITGVISYEEEGYAKFFSKIPEYTISSTRSTIPFSKFAKVPDELWE